MTAILADNCRPESESNLWTCKTAPQSICGTTPCPATPQPSYLCPSAVRAGGWEQWNDTEINQIAEYRPARHRTCIILIQLQWWWNHWSLRTPPCHHYCIICCLQLSCCSSPKTNLLSILRTVNTGGARYDEHYQIYTQNPHVSILLIKVILRLYTQTLY